MRSIIKHPDHAPFLAEIPTSLDTLQGIVGGYIDIVTGENYAVIFNEDLPSGSIIITGIKGEDLADVPESIICQCGLRV